MTSSTNDFVKISWHFVAIDILDLSAEVCFFHGGGGGGLGMVHHAAKPGQNRTSRPLPCFEVLPAK